MTSLNITSDLIISSKNLQITILADQEEIEVAICGTDIPGFGVPLKTLLKWRKQINFQTDQNIIITYNLRVVYDSRKSIFRRFYIPFWIKVLLRNW